jgi:hypothetical protein
MPDKRHKSPVMLEGQVEPDRRLWEETGWRRDCRWTGWRMRENQRQRDKDERSCWVVRYRWLMETGSSEEGYSFQEGRLLKAKRALRSLMMTAFALECSKVARGQRTREVTLFEREKVMLQTETARIRTLVKCMDLDSMVGGSAPGILMKETRCQKRV